MTTKTPLQILIVDDSREDRELYKRVLAQHPDYRYTFVEAESGEEGLSLYHTTEPDCILLDYQLPDLDGLGFLAAFSGDHGAINIPIIMLTGYGSETVVADAMRTGAADYLPKNLVSSQSLRRAVSNAIVKYKLQSTLEEQYRILEQTNQELRHKTEEIQRFYHMLSHELKTPLTSAREFVSIVLDGLSGPVSPKQREYLKIAKDSCDQMTLNLNDLLDTTRLDTNKLRMELRPGSIADVVALAIATMSPVARDKGIRLHQRIDTDVVDAFMDAKRITQVLTNLLSNAAKFTPADGEVEVAVQEDPQWPEWLLLSVSDTGRGIPPEQCNSVFERLYQVRSDDIVIEGGLGLGLHICREVVRLHGGEIWVESKLGEGSTFFFTVPKHQRIDVIENEIERMHESGKNLDHRG